MRAIGLFVAGALACALAAPAATGAPVRNLEGWYPPADPESASVRIGRRDAPPVALRFTGGRRSLAALGKAVLAGVSAGAPDELMALGVSKEEFEVVLWPEFPESRPATGLVSMDGWRTLSNRLTSGCRGAVSDWGGETWKLVRVETTAGVKEYRNFRLHRGIVLVARNAAGAEQRFDFVRTVVERKGVFKLYSMRD